VSSEKVRVTIRLPKPLLKRIDTYAESNAREFGVPVPREVAIRVLLTEALEICDRVGKRAP
jgi:hypothetical protein